MSPPDTHPHQATRHSERAEANVPHRADREPTPEEERAADKHESALKKAERDAVAEHEREMAERGAHQKGEGRPE